MVMGKDLVAWLLGRASVPASGESVNLGGLTQRGTHHQHLVISNTGENVFFRRMPVNILSTVSFKAVRFRAVALTPTTEVCPRNTVVGSSDGLLFAYALTSLFVASTYVHITRLDMLTSGTLSYPPTRSEYDLASQDSMPDRSCRRSV